MQWWADIWNGVANFFGYGHWEWGSAGEWVGAVGTALALCATVFIILSDKRRERRARANTLVSWVAADPYGGTPNATGRMPVVVIENTGNAPVLAVHVFHFDGSGFYTMFEASPPGSPHGSLVSGATVETAIPDYKYEKHDRLFLKFIDADNQHWTRNAVTGKYRRRDPWPYSSPWVFVRFQWERWQRWRAKDDT